MSGLSSVVSILTLVPTFLYAEICLAYAVHSTLQDVRTASSLGRTLEWSGLVAVEVLCAIGVGILAYVVALAEFGVA